MIELTSAQWSGWIAAFLYPLLRVLGLVLADPLLGNRNVPLAAKAALALLVAVLVAPLLPPAPAVDPASAAGVLIAVQQLLIGLAMGFSIRIALGAAQLAGRLAGLQIGLGFAAFYDPHGGVHADVIGRFFGLFATLIFFSVDGPHLVLEALVASFRALPVAATPVDALGLRQLVEWGAILFSAGLLIALPVIATSLIANIAVGVMTRAVPPLHLFSVGFPITLAAGLLALYLAAPFAGPALAQLLEQALLAVARLLAALAP